MFGYVNPVAFEVFGREIRWYAIFIVIGMLLAYAFAMRGIKKFKINENILIDGFIMGVIVGVIGARLYYCIMEWEHYKDNLLDVINPLSGWQGLAIHGGIIAAAIFVVIYCKVRKTNFWMIAEIVSVGFLIGQIFGRWGNFFNHEAYGANTFNTLLYGTPGMFNPDLLEKLLIPEFIIENMKISGYWWHPTFLYEMLWNIFGFCLILIIRNSTKKYWIGDGISCYAIWYSIGRFFIEGLRTDALRSLIFGLRQAQLISVALIIGGVILFIIRRKFKIYPRSYIEVVNENMIEQPKERLDGTTV